ncbi:MAG: hypothetical protein FD143_2905 [Ignavibacteria bacterium]|nr:MAG: hypothetical protein FD143_2905 [Ignavibacteria bacterium]
MCFCFFLVLFCFRFFSSVVRFEVVFFFLGGVLGFFFVFPIFPFVLIIRARVLCASFCFIPFLFRGASFCFSFLCVR